MRVLALVTDAFGGYGGIAQYNRDIVTALAGASDIAHVHVLPRLAPDAVPELPAKVAQARPIHAKIRYAFNAIIVAWQQKPDVVFSGHLYHGPLGRLIAQMTGAKLVSQLHGTEIWTRPRKHDRHALAASDMVLTVSRDTLGRLRDQVIEASWNGAVLANTVQAEFTPGDRDAARERFGLRPGQKALLSVARLDTREGYKGHDRVIALLPALRREGRDVIYLIAGTGEDRPRLERLAKEAGVADLVRFLGKVPYADLPDLYRAADLFVLPSTGEGFGIVYLEAMACGTPALGLRAGGAPDALGDGELGWCVEPDELGDTMRRALDSPRPEAAALHGKVIARFGQQAFRNRVAELFGGLKANVSPST